MRAVLVVDRSYSNKGKRSKNFLNNLKWVVLEVQDIEAMHRLI